MSNSGYLSDRSGTLTCYSVSPWDLTVLQPDSSGKVFAEKQRFLFGGKAYQWRFLDSLLLVKCVNGQIRFYRIRPDGLVALVWTLDDNPSSIMYANSDTLVLSDQDSLRIAVGYASGVKAPAAFLKVGRPRGIQQEILGDGELIGWSDSNFIFTPLRPDAKPDTQKTRFRNGVGNMAFHDGIMYLVYGSRLYTLVKETDSLVLRDSMYIDYRPYRYHFYGDHVVFGDFGGFHHVRQDRGMLTLIEKGTDPFTHGEFDAALLADGRIAIGLERFVYLYPGPSSAYGIWFPNTDLHAMALWGKDVVFSNGSGNIRLLEVESPQDMRWAGSFRMPDTLTRNLNILSGIAGCGEWLFLAFSNSYTYGLKIGPGDSLIQAWKYKGKFTGTADAQLYPYRAFCQDSVLVLGGSAATEIFRFSDGVEPKFAATLPAFNSLGMDGKWLVGRKDNTTPPTLSGSIYTLDDPAHPNLRYSVNIPNASSLKVTGDYFYFADGYRGLFYWNHTSMADSGHIRKNGCDGQSLGEYRDKLILTGCSDRSYIFALDSSAGPTALGEQSEFDSYFELFGVRNDLLFFRMSGGFALFRDLKPSPVGLVPARRRPLPNRKGWPPPGFFPPGFLLGRDLGYKFESR